jgi:hypothetical protein
VIDLGETVYGDSPRNRPFRPDYQDDGYQRDPRDGHRRDGYDIDGYQRDGYDHVGYQRDEHGWQQPSLGSLARGNGYPPPRLAPQPAHRPQAQQAQPAQQPKGRAQKVAMTGAEAVWYVMQCIAFGAGYFCKIPVKKALVDWGLLAELTGAEQFWYVLMNVGFGSGYFAKVIVSKALSDLPQFAQQRQANTVHAHRAAR